MPGFIAFCAGSALIIFLLRRDCQARPHLSRALWVPILLVLIVGSRPISLWLQGGLISEAGEYLEGSRFDRWFYLSLILAGFAILQRRGVQWAEVFTQNRAFLCFYLYLLLSVAWSDFPLVSLKRLFKDFGCVVLVLVILTEKNPAEAIRAVFLRCAYILLPLSVVFIKYFPDLGRAYTRSGEPMVTGVTTQKNSLGILCMVTLFFLIWELVEVSKARGVKFGRGIRWEHVAILLMGLWLLYVSESKTALLCFLIAAGLLLWRRLPAPAAGGLLLFALIMPALLFLANQLFGSIVAPIVESLGRDMTFTGRTRIWAAVLAQPINSLFGSGYFSFWLTEEGEAVWRIIGSRAATAHNGYLELYLDGGLIAVGLLIAAFFKNGFRYVPFLSNSVYRARFAILMAAILYNLSEATYARLSLMWFCTVWCVLEFRFPVPTSVPVPSFQESECSPQLS